MLLTFTWNIITPTKNDNEEMPYILNVQYLRHESFKMPLQINIFKVRCNSEILQKIDLLYTSSTIGCIEIESNDIDDKCTEN